MIAEKAGLKHIRLHDARHSHATVLIKQGVPAKVVAERLGHSSITTTMNIYAHVLPEMQQSAVQHQRSNTLTMRSPAVIIIIVLLKTLNRNPLNLSTKLLLLNPISAKLVPSRFYVY
jgi:hypothetical protein